MVMVGHRRYVRDSVIAWEKNCLLAGLAGCDGAVMGGFCVVPGTGQAVASDAFGVARRGVDGCSKHAHPACEVRHALAYT